MLLVGDSSVAVVRRDDGSLVAQAPLSVPVRSVVCGDVDGDGYSDVVLLGELQYSVLSLSVHRGSTLFPRLLFGLLCALLAAVCAQLALYSPVLRGHVHSIVKRAAHAE